MNMDVVFNIVIVVFTVSNLAAMGLELNLRDAFELAVENVEGSVNNPLGQLRGRLNDTKLFHRIGTQEKKHAR